MLMNAHFMQNPSTLRPRISLPDRIRQIKFLLKTFIDGKITQFRSVISNFMQNDDEGDLDIRRGEASMNIMSPGTM
jgi:hypothetical protein